MSVADDLSTQKSTLTNIQADSHETDHRAITIKAQIDPEILHLLDAIPVGKPPPYDRRSQNTNDHDRDRGKSTSDTRRRQNDYDNRGYSGSNHRSDNREDKRQSPYPQNQPRS